MFRKFRNWCWKHFFPRSWANLEKRVQEQMKQLYSDVDKFLAYGDSIQKFYNPTDMIFSSSPIRNDNPNAEVRISGAEVSETEYMKLFTPAQIEAFQESIARQPRRIIMGSPNDKIEFLDSPRIPPPPPLQLTLDDLEKELEESDLPITINDPNASVEIHGERCEPVFEPAQIENAYTPNNLMFGIDLGKIGPHMPVVANLVGKFFEVKQLIESRPRDIDPSLVNGVEEYIEFLKNDIAAGCGIPKEELFSSQPVLAGSGAEISERFFFDQWHYPRSHGRTTAQRLSRIYQNLWNNNIPQTEEQEGDFLEAIKNGLERWQAEYMQNPAPSPEPYPLWRDLRMQQLAARRLRGEVVWSGTLRTTDVSLKDDIAKTIEIRHERHLRGVREREIKSAFRVYISYKSSFVKKERTCFTDKCETILTFGGFIDTNTPKTFKGYYKLRELWNSEYIQLYCCNCFEAKELESRKITKVDEWLYNNE